MEPSPNPAPQTDSPEDPVHGVLVVQNGRASGTRRALTGPLTLIGQAAGCDVRLNVDGVNPLHCALIHGPGGLMVRDLGSDSGSRVNGEAVATRALRSGDEIGVGPFVFRLELPEGAEGAPDVAALEAERDALRIQAAAVAAQQAGLTEEELRLQQLSTALDRQEEQLAAHLEERQRRLADLQEQVRADRAALREERAAARQEQEQLRTSLTEARAEAESAGKLALKERQRLVELRKRLRRRWRRHWQDQEATLRRREAELAAGRQQLQQDREKLAQAQLQFNGEAELGRRQLKEEWQELALAQQQWEECLNQEHAERERRLRDLAGRSTAVAAAEQAQDMRRREWEQVEADLRKEVEGLEARVRALRQKLAEEQRQGRGPEAGVSLSGLPAPLSPAPAVPGEDRREWPAVVRQLAGTLADQRLHLIEQWQRLLGVHHSWQDERAGLLADIEGLGRQLAGREEKLAAGEKALEAGLAELRQRHEALAQARCYVEGWQARLTAREAAWEAERGALVGQVRLREEAAVARGQRLERLQQRRVQRWRREVDDLRGARERCEGLRRQYAALWQECQERQGALAQAERDLAAQHLALERGRQELLARAPNSAAAERRLERLRRRGAARLEAAARQVRRARQEVGAEARRLEAWARLLHEQDADLAGRLADWSRRQAEWEDRQAAAGEAEERRRQEVQRLEVLRAQDERQLAELREEVERIARLLLDGVDPAVPPAQQAA